MKIGNLDFGKYPLLLAPMEDVTDESFRLMCKEFGADMVYTEFVSSDALVRNINSTMRKLSIQDVNQIFLWLATIIPPVYFLRRITQD